MIGDEHDTVAARWTEVGAPRPVVASTRPGGDVSDAILDPIEEQDDPKRLGLLRVTWVNPVEDGATAQLGRIDPERCISRAVLRVRGPPLYLPTVANPVQVVPPGSITSTLGLATSGSRPPTSPKLSQRPRPSTSIFHSSRGGSTASVFDHKILEILPWVSVVMWPRPSSQGCSRSVARRTYAGRTKETSHSATLFALEGD